MIFYYLFLLILGYTIFTYMFAYACREENVPRAFKMGLVQAILMTLGLGIYTWAWAMDHLSNGFAEMVQLVVASGGTLFTVALFLPIGRRPQSLLGTEGLREAETEQFNQKDTAFNKAHVGGYGPQVAKRRWSLLKRDPFAGLFWGMTMGLRGQVDGNTNADGQAYADARAAATDIKKQARYLGADIVGITTINQDFVYSEAFSYEDSKMETGPAVTRPIDLNHKYIIVFGREMDYLKIDTTVTPRNDESVGEIGKTYYDLAETAVTLAAYIRQRGYPATAHHLRNEQIALVPHAVNAGLGEEGRHTYLITPKFGPRVRLAAVTTDLELLVDKPVDIGVQHFCEICRLCETNCPPQALSPVKKVIRGYRKWPQDQDSCFKFWVSGFNTWSCTLCLKVCPWNKPNTFVHQVSFFAASRSWLARWVLYLMTVIFWGPKTPWQRISEKGVKIESAIKVK